MPPRRARTARLALAALAALAPAVRSQDPPPVVSAQDTVPADAPQAPAPQHSSRLQGSAYFDRNHDVVGGTVVVQPMADPSVLYLTSTDAAGRFRVDGLPDGEYRVRIERHGVLPVTKEAVQVRFPFRAVVELSMQASPSALPAVAQNPADAREAPATVRIEGTVRDQDLAPLADARLRLVHAEGRVDPVIVTSGEDGAFAIETIPGGTWQLAIHGIGALPVRTTITLVADTKIQATLVRQPSTYVPSPLDLMPPEQPIPPGDLGNLRLGG